MVKLHTVLCECCEAPDTVSTLKKKIIYTNQEVMMKLMVWKILDYTLCANHIIVDITEKSDVEPDPEPLPTFFSIIVSISL